MDDSLFLPQNKLPFCPPTLPTNLLSSSRLCVLADKPDASSLATGRALTGKADDVLWTILEQLGVSKSQTLRAYTGLGDQQHRDALNHAFNKFRPNCILYIPNDSPNRTSLAGVGWPEKKISEYRGTIFCPPTSIIPAMSGVKLVATYHPMEVLRVYSYMPLFKFDLRRAVTQSTFPEHRPPQRVLEVCSGVTDAIARLTQIKLDRKLIALDIEGGVTGMTCISFATSRDHAFTIPIDKFSDAQLRDLMPVLASVLSDPSIPKCLQNSLYDNFVLSYSYRIPILGVVDDTMLSGWEIYQELRKGLATQTSIWTEEPYYKFERKIEDAHTHYIYCAKDSAVTYEIRDAHEAYFNTRPNSHRHYRFNISLLPALLYMELKGIRYNQELAFQKRQEVEHKMSTIEARLRSIASPNYNPKSSVQTNNLLYKKLKFPPQHPDKVDGFGKDKSRLTSNMDALLDLLQSFQHPVIFSLLEYRRLQKLHEQLSILCDPDGRVRTSYDIVGTETGRLSSRKSPTESGFNLQTITKQLRVLYQADPGYVMGQFDLSGADGWTVAAWCARLGDDTMLEDYKHGIKPAKVIALMYRGVNVARMTRAELKTACKAVTDEGPDGWQYFACKQVQHGTNYLLGIKTMAANILKSSFKQRGEAIIVTTQDCDKLQRLYKARYPGVVLWQDHCKRQLETTGVLEASCGNVRKFFGRRKDNTTHREYVAHEPQINTTYSTMLAFHRLWHDPDNSGPIIQPVHQVHDALIAQWPEDRHDWAVEKIKSYFDNPITIAGYSIVIPFEGGYGPDWKNTTEPV